MEISSSIHTANIPHAYSGVSRSDLQTERPQVPVARHIDSFSFSDNARTKLSSLNSTPQPEAQTALQTSTYNSVQPLANQVPSASNEPAANKGALAGETPIANEKQDTQTEEPAVNSSPANNETSSANGELSEDELSEVEQLQQRDTQVRAHEQAHLSAAGNLTVRGANFTFETGPDGKRYAVGGEVSIDTSVVADNPQATLRKAQQIRRAATAPVDPSSQDRFVAAEASRMEAQARVELSEQTREKQQAYIDENAPEVDFLGPKIDKAEQNIQDTYQRIQNSSVLQAQRPFVDFFI